MHFCRQAATTTLFCQFLQRTDTARQLHEVALRSRRLHPKPRRASRNSAIPLRSLRAKGASSCP
eukprot:4408781-Alexandrium_andersonii.AAC.1